MEYVETPRKLEDPHADPTYVCTHIIKYVYDTFSMTYV